MGAAGVVMGAALAVGAASMGKKPEMSYATDVHSTMVPGKPETPEQPTTVETASSASTTSNLQMEEARERERQQAALRRKQAQEVFTSGLGAAGLAETSRKTLLGG